jgi:hypothetical protein
VWRIRLLLTPDWIRHHGSTEDASFPSEQAIAIGDVRKYDCLEALSVFVSDRHSKCDIQSPIAQTLNPDPGTGKIVPEQKCDVCT